jgi:8-oxo-dGTP diphosphatase
MRARPAARWIILNADNRVLLFKFEFKTGPLAGARFWATPGGAVDAGETYEQAAVRELFEETGLKLVDPGPQIAQCDATFRAPDGEPVTADERYFRLHIERLDLSRDAWTALEREVMTAHRWWSAEEILASEETIWPKTLAELIKGALV